MGQRKIKLCIIHPNLKCGGSEKFIAFICNNINTNIFDVELYILDGSALFYKITNPDIRQTYLAIKNVRKSLFTILNIIKRTKPGILFTASNHLNLFISIFKFLLPKRIKFIARESSIISINSKRSKYGKPYEWLIKKFYRNIDHIICQSAYMQYDLIKNYKIEKEKTIIIHNPVEEIAGVKISGINKTKYKFFTVGRLSPEKGVDRLLNALSLLPIDFNFHIIGDGSEKNNLQELSNKLGLREKIIFEGQRSHPYQDMNDADLFLIGSHYEGFPNVLLEAGILGIPVVGFNSTGGTNEIIQEGFNGFLAEDNNIQSLADTILKAVNHNFNRELIRDHTNEKFSAVKIIRQLENYLTKIAL